MASAKVGSSMTSCHASTGNWLVSSVDPAAVAVFDDLHQIAALVRIETIRRQSSRISRSAW